MASSFANTNVITVQPAYSKTNPFKELNGNWNVGLFDCCTDVSKCCYVFWCTPCYCCSLASKLDESIWSCCCVGYALPMYRMKVRSILKIQGDTFSDHCAVLWCPCCVALQMDNELKVRNIA
ncbi:unnamed protein product [Adineta steineri]|uniref:Cornifelin-like protein n=2 Tax=Adineta steineri TaxID=433720 RepID=A0A818S176_9BILA|nr:unnamed protein product [Adineta steineri]CAF1427799.1 unnamed protein product [Adineta steineri]CAF3666268.1 unnamed protein product [Adineta steineri]